MPIFWTEWIGKRYVILGIVITKKGWRGCAIARALANNPKLLIADEPTGNLDPTTADHVFVLLQDLVKSQGLALLMATHNHELAAKMGRVVELRDGVLTG